MRNLSAKFISDLREPTGVLYPIHERVGKDHTLMLAIRSDYVNIYYRGGNILKITNQNTGSYQAFFDNKYGKSGQQINLPYVISCQEDANKWIDYLPLLKQTMDFFFSQNNKPEREFQQLIARENNSSIISNETEYFITDIEFADSELGARFDMLAIRWLANQRKSAASCRPALIEMKYGDGALGGSAGLVKHLDDINTFVSDRKRFGELLRTMEGQFNQLGQLNLLKYNRSAGQNTIRLDDNEKPEVVFILANHNPRSTQLKSILTDQSIDEYDRNGAFDLRFYVASFAGYGLHANCMLTLNEFRKLLGCHRV